ncbi:amino acid permease [Arenicella sp. 4NH20-0111]|uniref:APC family permease n=1 Tax=Arenicella sp. 4NH20-0111 TaxID=3127648 RepID=UPI003108ECE8
MTLGFWRSWSLVVGMMIGSGIFTLPAVLAPYGGNSFIAWAVAVVGALSLVFSLSYLSARNPRAGGPQAFVLEAFGRQAAIIVAWGYWISVLVAVAAIALSFAGYLAVFLPVLESNQLYSSAAAIVVVWIFTLISLRGTEEASIVQLVTSILKILPLLLIGVCGLALGDFSSIENGNPKQESFPTMISGILLLIMWSYIGIESATIPAEDTIDPKKTIPRALLAGTLTATAVYVISLLGVMSLLPMNELASSQHPFSDAAKSIFGASGAWFIAVGALISIGGALNACVFLTGVVPSAGANDRLFPRWLGDEGSGGSEDSSNKGAEEGTIGRRAILFSSTLATLLIMTNAHKGLLKSFELMILVSTFSVLIAYLGAALASVKLQWADREKGVAVNSVTFANSLLASAFSAFALFGAWSLYN